jgi:hypothetical protein
VAKPNAAGEDKAALLEKAKEVAAGLAGDAAKYVIIPFIPL